MEHTFLTISAKWIAEGYYYDEDNNSYKLKGLTNITKDETQWSSKGYMEIFADKPLKFYNDYALTSLDDGVTVSWESINPVLGKLIGTFNFISEAITSIYTSEDKRITGIETLVQIDENTYKTFGISYNDGKKMSSWSAVLKRQI